MHQVVKAYLANQRQGNHATKTRGLVIGGNQKPWRQKGTGRARQGSTRAPHWVGGGTVFGPTPRSHAQSVPRKVRQLARKSAFNARARENALFIIDAFNYDSPGTNRLRNLLTRLEVDGRNVLVLTNGMNRNVFLSGRNLPNVQVMPFDDVSTYHILWSHFVLVEGRAIGHELEPVAEREAATPVRSEAAARTSKKSAADAGQEKEKRPSSKKAASRSRAPARKKAATRKAASGGRTVAAKKRSVAKKAAGTRAAAKPRRKEK
jgi:large subunit ribosomal protein L4